MAFPTSLADPGILGINSGAAFMAVLSVWLLDFSAPLELGMAALMGAFIATAFIVFIAQLGKGRPDALRLILVGAAITAIFGALTSAVLEFSQESVNVFRFWIVGSLASGDGSQAAAGEDVDGGEHEADRFRFVRVSVV